MRYRELFQPLVQVVLIYQHLSMSNKYWNTNGLRVIAVEGNECMNIECDLNIESGGQ